MTSLQELSQLPIPPAAKDLLIQYKRSFSSLHPDLQSILTTPPQTDPVGRQELRLRTWLLENILNGNIDLPVVETYYSGEDLHPLLQLYDIDAITTHIKYPIRRPTAEELIVPQSNNIPIAANIALTEQNQFTPISLNSERPQSLLIITPESISNPDAIDFLNTIIQTTRMIHPKGKTIIFDNTTDGLTEQSPDIIIANGDRATAISQALYYLQYGKYAPKAQLQIPKNAKEVMKHVLSNYHQLVIIPDARQLNQTETADNLEMAVRFSRPGLQVVIAAPINQIDSLPQKFKSGITADFRSLKMPLRFKFSGKTCWTLKSQTAS